MKNPGSNICEIPGEIDEGIPVGISYGTTKSSKRRILDRNLEKSLKLTQENPRKINEFIPKNNS